MTLLTPQAKSQNAAQTAPRTTLLTGGQYRCFLAATLANALRGSRRKRKSEPFETGTGKQTHDAKSAPPAQFICPMQPPKHFPQCAGLSNLSK